MEWIDPEWPATLKMSLARVWGMYEDGNKLRLRENVVNAEENFRVVKEKEQMEKDCIQLRQIFQQTCIPWDNIFRKEKDYSLKQ